MSSSTADVGVVIPALNEAGRLDRALAGLAWQTQRPALVKVMDGGSTDGTPARARDVGARLGLTVSVDENGGNIGGACHNGCMEVAGELDDDAILVRTDADSVFAPDFIDRAVEALDDSSVSMFGARTKPLMAEKPCGCDYRADEAAARHTFALVSNLNKNPKGRASAFRAADFMAVNGYCLCGEDVCVCDPDWYEDAILAEKLRTQGQVVLSNSTAVYSRMPGTTLSSISLWRKHKHWRRRVLAQPWK